MSKTIAPVSDAETDVLQRFFDRDCTIMDQTVRVPFASHGEAVQMLRRARRAAAERKFGARPLTDDEIAVGAAAFDPDEAELAAFTKGVRYVELLLRTHAVHLTSDPGTGVPDPPLPVNDALPPRVEAMLRTMKQCHGVPPVLYREDDGRWVGECRAECGQKVFASTPRRAVEVWNLEVPR